MSHIIYLYKPEKLRDLGTPKLAMLTKTRRLTAERSSGANFKEAEECGLMYFLGPLCKENHSVWDPTGDILAQSLYYTKEFRTHGRRRCVRCNIEARGRRRRAAWDAVRDYKPASTLKARRGTDDLLEARALGMTLEEYLNI